MQIFSYSPEELKAIIADAVNDIVKGIPSNGQKQYDFVNDQTARCILAGSDKPIAKETFNKLRRDKKIGTYHSTEGRNIYSREELHTYIKSTKD